MPTIAPRAVPAPPLRPLNPSLNPSLNASLNPSLNPDAQPAGRRGSASVWLIALALAATLVGCQPGAPIQPRADGSTRDATTSRERTGTSDATRGEHRRRNAEAKAHAQAGRPIEARLQHVQDGDSFVAIIGRGERLTIRIAGIDAPERTQPWADAARRQLREQLEGHAFTLHPIKADPYGRLVARVTRPANTGDVRASVDVALTQLTAGAAWYFERYESDLPPADRIRYREAADSARRNRRGLWSEPTPQAPWLFREQATRLR